MVSSPTIKPAGQVVVNPDRHFQSSIAIDGDALARAGVIPVMVGATWPDRKQVFRNHGDDGHMVRDVPTIEGDDQDGG